MTIVNAITGVFTEIGSWLVTAVNSLIPMFWTAEAGLTLLGSLSIIGLAISVTFLLIGVIQNFLHFRG